MQKKVWEFIRQHDMIQKGDRIVAGISGGADSVFLFFLLLELKEKQAIDFAVVHVNHMLRGEEAERDEIFVRRLCQSHGIFCRIYRISIKDIAGKEKISLEEAGRIRRYQAFYETAGEWGASKIALAHHRNDCAETMLYHLARGTGIGGLCSLRPVRNELIRPLLCMNRKEIEQYLEERQISYCTDSTNEDTAYSRNYIRRCILPGLCGRINEKAVEHMASTAEDLAQIWDYLEEQTKKLMDGTTEKRDGGLLIREELSRQESLFQRMVIKKCLEEAAGTKRDFARVHVCDILSLWEKDTGKSLNLPYGIIARRVYQGIWLRKKDIRDGWEKDNEPVWIQLTVPGRTGVGELWLETALMGNTGEIIPQKKYTKWIDYDKIKDTLVIRTRLPGDYIVINKQGGRKKIKDFFIDQKIPREERDRILLVADGSEVVWLVGYRLSPNYMVGEETGNILRIKIKGGTMHEG